MAQFLTITNSSKNNKKSKSNSIPAIFDAETTQFMCCDDNHNLHKSITLDSQHYPVTPGLNQKNEQKISHQHGTITYTINCNILTDDFLLENGTFITIFQNKVTRCFKKPKELFNYLLSKSWISQKGMNNFNTYSFLRKDLLTNKEKLETSSISSFGSDQRLVVLDKDKNTQKLLQKEPQFFDQNKEFQKTNKSKTKIKKLEIRRLKEARFSVRISNLERKRKEAEYDDLYKKYKKLKRGCSCSKSCKK